MTAKTGKSAAIVAHVAAHPGITRLRLHADLGMRSNNGLLRYCVRQGLVHGAGSRSTYRLYPTAEQAAAAHDQLVAQAAARRKARRRADDLRSLLRKRLQRQAAGGRSYPTKPGRHGVVIEPGVQLAPDVRVTIAPPMRDRWA
jgi:hypothetical protein